MRVGAFIKEKNVGFGTFLLACAYLNLDCPRLTSNLSEEKLELIDKTISSNDFFLWSTLKLKIAQLENQNIQNLVKLLTTESKEQINIILGERILNALKLELNSKSFDSADKEKLSNIFQQDNSILEKIDEIKQYLLSKKHLDQKADNSFLSELKPTIKDDFDEEKSDDRDQWDGIDYERAVMRALQNGYGDQFGFD